MTAAPHSDLTAARRSVRACPRLARPPSRRRPASCSGSWDGLLLAPRPHDAHFHRPPPAADVGRNAPRPADAWGSHAADPECHRREWRCAAAGASALAEHGGKRHAHPQHPSSAHATSSIRLPNRAPINSGTAARRSTPSSSPSHTQKKCRNRREGPIGASVQSAAGRSPFIRCIKPPCAPPLPAQSPILAPSYSLFCSAQPPSCAAVSIQTVSIGGRARSCGCWCSSASSCALGSIQLEVAAVMTSGTVACHYGLMQACQVSAALSPTTHR
ncbi:hypothetical protein PVAP13_1NG176900 [Panicum virgatum]|uniref:Uncharacterized protein n=1 Tax=Panicum virgatum TaxID=38727 RepID=A0A8T0WRS5_PANVG|nr:hypothetical protein PVAP13_1NG176900 [Panicum virgatum]